MLKGTIIGNLTRDPERGTDRNGSEYAKFTIACNNFVGNSKDTTFVSCVAFGQRGKFALNYLHRGQPVYADGKLNLFIPPDGGKPVLRLDVESLESVRSSGGSQEASAYDNAPPAHDAPVRSAVPIPEGAVDITDKILRGEEPDLPF